LHRETCACTIAGHGCRTNASIEIDGPRGSDHGGSASLSSPPSIKAGHHHAIGIFAPLHFQVLKPVQVAWAIRFGEFGPPIRGRLPRRDRIDSPIP